MMPPAPPPTPSIPDHELRKLIGQGAYGDVWLARNRVTGALRAVKVVHRERFESARPYERELAGMRRFEPVSRAHDGLVDVLRVGALDGDKGFFCVMELADSVISNPCAAINRSEQGAGHIGAALPTAALLNTDLLITDYSPRTLRSDLARCGRLPIAEVHGIALALADAVDHLHQRGLLHRDIKPSNLIFVGGVPKLADIGLVAQTSDRRDRRETVSLVGTEGYIPPEGHGDERGDIYSLGKVIYEMAFGRDRRDFPDAPTALADWPERAELQELNEIILRACAPDPAQRYATVAELRADLRLLVEGKSLRRLRRLEARLGKLRRAALAAGLVALLAAGGWSYQRRQSVRLGEVAAESQQRLVQLNVANGLRLLDAGDYTAALVWFVEALKRDAGEAEREWAHRRRIGAVLEQCPRLEHSGDHSAAISGMDFSPDGRWFVTASEDRTARVWNAGTGAPVTPPMLHEGAVNEAHFSRDGRWIVTAADSGEARVWDAATGRPRGGVIRHARAVLMAKFSPDGQRVVTASKAKSARVWQAGDGTPVTPPLEHGHEVYYAEFSPDGLRVVSASTDGTARLWHAESGAPIGPPLGHGRDVREARFSPDGRKVLTASFDRTARLWSADTGEPLGAPMELSVGVYAASFSRDGRRMVAGGGLAKSRGEARVWDTETGRPVGPVLVHPVGLRSVAFSPDGRWVVAGCFDRTARVWDAQTGEAVCPPLRHQHFVWTAVFSPDGHRVLTSGREEVWRLWRLPQGARVTTGDDHPVMLDASNHASSHDAARRQLLKSDDHGNIVVWALAGETSDAPRLERRGMWSRVKAKGQSQFQWRPWETIGDGRPATNSWDDAADFMNERFARPALSPDGRTLITANKQREIEGWDTGTGERTFRFQLEAFDVGRILISPDGSRFLTCTRPDGGGTGPGEARLWFTADGRPATPPFGVGAAVSDAAFSPDGRRVVLTANNVQAQVRSTRIWDTTTGQPIGEPLTHSGSISGVALSADGRRVATSSEDGTARIWDAVTGQPVLGPIRHDAPVRWVAFSADGRLLATDAGAQEARVWDARTGQPLSPPLRHPQRADGLWFSADGERLWLSSTLEVNGRYAPRIQIWRLPLAREPVEALEALSQRLAGVKVDEQGGLTSSTRPRLR